MDVGQAGLFRHGLGAGDMLGVEINPVKGCVRISCRQKIQADAIAATKITIAERLSV